MTQHHRETRPPVQPVSVRKRMVAGASIDLLLSSLFLPGVRMPSPAWGKRWMLGPLIFVPLARALGGLCTYMITLFSARIGVNRIVALMAGLMVGVAGLWLGMVLGLAGPCGIEQLN